MAGVDLRLLGFLLRLPERDAPPDAVQQDHNRYREPILYSEKVKLSVLMPPRLQTTAITLTLLFRSVGAVSGASCISRRSLTFLTKYSQGHLRHTLRSFWAQMATHLESYSRRDPRTRRRLRADVQAVPCSEIPVRYWNGWYLGFGSCYRSGEFTG